MKTKILFIMIAFTTFCNAQIINFPDANFKAKLLSAQTSNAIASNQNPTSNNLYTIWSVPSYNKIDTNNDGEIQISEAQDIQWLDVSSASITNMSGIENFTNLKYLNCKYNSLNTLNLSQLLNLEALNCFSSNISSINVTNLNNLNNLSCGSNNLSNLNLQGVTNLIKLNCSYNLLNDLDISNLLQLQELSCGHNQLVILNLAGLNNISNLSCNSNQLQNLDVSNLLNLQNIDCSNNNIINLNVQNLINLKYITCSTNQITLLNIQNLINLENLNCSGNQLASLNFDNLINLQYVKCGGNLLTSLDLHNCPNLSRVECLSNKLQYLNIKNGIHSYNLLVNNLYFQNNPNLTYICCDESEIDSVQIIANAYNVNCNIGSYCSFTPNGTFYTIQGNSKFDYNSNGCDSNDIVYPNFKCSITDGTNTGAFIANNSGSYNIPVQAGTHTVTPIIENPAYFNVSPSNLQVSFPATTSPFTQNFCITPNGVHHDVEVTLIPITAARPGFNATYKIIYKNKGNQVENGTVTLTYLNQDALDIVSCNPAFILENSDGYEKTLTWNYIALKPFETREITVVLNLNGQTETPALNIGETLSMTSTVTPDINDEYPIDNSFSIHQVIVGSYDPNDKTCIEGTIITPAMVGEYVHYVIRFENTGTYPAENVVVKDIIDTSKFDINTLIPIKGSHDFETRISNTNKVEFIFENINLPFDDATNDGYIAFKIKTKPNLVLGNTFSNQANIYFDYNFPIVTNNYTTTVQNTLGLQENELINDIVAYPNPVKDFLNFKTEQNVLKVEVYDISGRILSSNSVNENKTDLSNLKTGNYILKVYTEKGIMNTKIIKE